jgi:hypothetical protein
MIKTTMKYLVAIILACAITFSTSSTFACGEYAVFIYKITKVENGQYWGTEIYNNSNVYFIQENVLTGEKFKVNDVVIAYFDPDNITDGLIGVEKAIPVGFE